ncbi:MAG: nickel pincer cofactor biosynthesis protein LarC [Planctomycetota bacterium]
MEGRSGTVRGASAADELLVEPFGGMAGDMLLAALLDLDDARFQRTDLQAFADSVVPGEARLSAETVWRGSMSGTHLEVVTPESGAAPHRGLAELGAIVDRSALSPGARTFTMAVLRRIAEAEGWVHGCAPEEVHFHEVGAVDTIVDVGGAALALDRLGIERAYATPPLLGSGTVRCAHGEMPVPAPATAEILRGLPHRTGGGGGERCTPTGAALLVELARLGRETGGSVDASPRFGPPAGVWETGSIGYGAGTRDPSEGPPNLLRVQTGRAGDAPSAGLEAAHSVDEVRVNLDDMTPEEIGDLVVALRDAGALEVWTSAVAMKKDRPGVLLTALVRAADRPAIVAILFELSSTFGVRWSPVERVEAGRSFRTVEVEGVTVRIKVRARPAHPGRTADGAHDLFCEHDDVAALARQLSIPLREARARALAALEADG